MHANLATWSRHGVKFVAQRQTCTTSTCINTSPAWLLNYIVTYFGLIIKYTKNKLETYFLPPRENPGLPKPCLEYVSSMF